MNDDADVKGGPQSVPKPSAKALDDGYNQTYIIMKNENENENAEEKNSDHDNDVFFRCGNWCYKGQIQFNGLKLGTSDLTLLIPTLQKQQGSLQYYCSSLNVPSSSDFSEPLKFLRKATEFVASEMTSLSIEKELKKMANVFPWIDADGAATYFEMTLNNIPDCMENVGLVASKTYSRGLIVVSIFCEKTFYFVIQSGEGDQPLLDVRFPDVSKHGQGLLLQSYNDITQPWRKLTLWHILDHDAITPVPRVVPKIRTLNISSANYQQTYCVMKSSFDSESSNYSVHHDVLFRFGSWCYAGRVQLTPTLTLSDIPFVIPALRMQQGRLDYYCDVSNIPTNSPFAKSLEYMQKLEPLIEAQIFNSEDVLRALIDRLSKMGLGETVVKWLDGDPNNSFFEFKLVSDAITAGYFKNIELIASKCYHPSGVITVTIVFQDTIYVTILDGDKENPLLDSRFPDVSGKGRGYQIQALKNGLPEWPELRKISVWQTVSALEEEFRERAIQLAQQKKEEENLTQEACATDNVNDSNRSNPTAVSNISSVAVGIVSSMGNISLDSDMLSTSETRTPGREKEEVKGRCSPIHSRSASRASISTPFSETHCIPDMAEEKQTVRGSSAGSHRPSFIWDNRDNNIDDVNMDKVSRGPSRVGSVSYMVDNNIDDVNMDVAGSKPSRGPSRTSSLSYMVDNNNNIEDINMDMLQAKTSRTPSRTPSRPSSMRSITGSSAKETSSVSRRPSFKVDMMETFEDEPIEVSESDRESVRDGVRSRESPGLDGVRDGVRDTPLRESPVRDRESPRQVHIDPIVRSDDGSPTANIPAIGFGSRGGGLSSMSSSLARPHHLPRMDNPLSKRMDEIRKTMGDGIMDAPWDLKGRPLKKNVLSSPGHDGSKK